MNILLTSGGTKVPIDLVRSITNMSRGTFGSKIARQLLARSEAVDLTYLGAKEFRFPFSIRVDFADHQRAKTQRLWAEAPHSGDNVEKIKQVVDRACLYELYKHRYQQVSYKTFDDYLDIMRGLENPNWDRPDVVMLAAAVSDYIVKDPLSGKYRSEDDLVIALQKSEKIIGQVRQWHPDCCLVGFKLLVNSTDEELVSAAKKSLEQNGCAFVVANDLRDIKASKHRLLIVSPVGVEEYHSDPEDPEYLARVVAEKTYIVGMEHIRAREQ